MSKRIDAIKSLMQEEGNSSKVISALVDLVESMEKELEALQNDMDAVNEDLSLLSDGMHIEEFNSIVDAVCPYCGEEIEIDLDNLEDEDEFKCPHCEKEITLEWDECECGCGHDHDDCDCDDCDDCEDEE